MCIRDRIELARLRIVLVFSVLERRFIARKLLVQLKEDVFIAIELDAARFHEFRRGIDRIRTRDCRERGAIVHLLPEWDLLFARIRVRKLAGAFAQFLGCEVFDGGAALFEQERKHLILSLIHI